MLNAMRILCFLALTLLSINDGAADTVPFVYGYRVSASFGTTKVSACEAWGQASWPGSNYTWTVSSHDSCVRDGGDLFQWITAGRNCPNPPGGLDQGGSECQHVPACDAGETRDPQTHICQTPPTTCIAGETKTLIVPMGIYPPPGAPMEVRLVKEDSGTSTELEPLYAQEGGCTYTIPRTKGLMSDCKTNGGTIMYCTAYGTKTGGIGTAGDTALDAASVQQTVKVPSASEGCLLTRSGAEICNVTAKQNCGKVNGSEICVADNGNLTSGGYPAAIVDGKVVTDTPNVNGQVPNCFANASGKTVCIEKPSSSSCGPGTFIACLEPENNDPGNYIGKTPISNDVKEVTKTVTVTNPDGTKTKIDTTTTNINGSTPSVTTTNYDTNGQVTDTQTTQGDLTGTQNQYGTGTGVGAGASVAAGGSGASTGADSALYTATDKTFQSVTEAGINTIKNSPIISFGTKIFGVTIPPGTCPIFTLPSVMNMPPIVIDAFCSQMMTDTVWPMVSNILKIISVLMAFRIAIGGFL